MKEYLGVLVLDDKTYYVGKMPFEGKASGEICFNTAVTGYQEAITDPSYTEQIITFTFPYIGNTGFNKEDIESMGKKSAKGVIVRNKITTDSNYRSEGNLIDFLKANNIPVLYGVDTREITFKIRSKSISNCIISSIKNEAEIPALIEEACQLPNMDGMELSSVSSVLKPLEYANGGGKTVVVIDYGVKENILKIFAEEGLKVIVVPFDATFEEICKHSPSGVFLSNGPGDPRETLKHTAGALKKTIKAGIPIFGICLGHQLLCGLFGAKLIKLPQGHRGANQPVIRYETGKIEITPQNHGFACSDENLPSFLHITHRSLFDGVIEGIEIKAGTKILIDGEEITSPDIFAVQYHPEGSAGPNDSKYLFQQFFSTLK